MEKKNKTSAPIAAAFFIFSLAIMPFSLRVVGFTLTLDPSLSAAVDVWDQIAGSFGGAHQPSAELLAINNLASDEAAGSTTDSADRNSLLASMEQPVVAPVFGEHLSAAEVETIDGTVPQARTQKPVFRQACSVKRVNAGTYYKAIQARIEQRFEALRAAEAAQREVAANNELLKGLDKQFAAVKFDFKLIKNLPFNRDMKVFVKLKPVRPLVAPKLTACDLRRALTGGKDQRTRQREAQLRVTEVTPVTSENSEL